MDFEFFWAALQERIRASKFQMTIIDNDLQSREKMLKRTIAPYATAP